MNTANPSNKVRCPACGSEDVVRTAGTRNVCVPFAEPVPADTAAYFCKTCTESGDFARENDAKYLIAEEAAKKSSVQNMIVTLGQQEISMAYFERALRLPQRTVARWQNGNFSASAIALLRIIRICPSMLAVAEGGFRERDYEDFLVREAGKVMLKRTINSSAKVEGVVSINVSNDSVEINARVTLTCSIPDAHAIETMSQYISSGG